MKASIYAKKWKRGNLNKTKVEHKAIFYLHFFKYKVCRGGSCTSMAYIHEQAKKEQKEWKKVLGALESITSFSASSVHYYSSLLVSTCLLW